jgi:SAM-dependent methyltransferase
MPTADLQTVLAKERELMNFYAPHYQTSYFINSYFYREDRRMFTDWIIKTLRRNGREPEKLSILEVGTATGDVLDLLATAGCLKLTGLDIAEEMLAVAHHRVPIARFIRGSVEHHDFGTERFDVVIATFTLHHMYNPRAFFDLVHRILAPDGWFFIKDYNADGWVNRPGTKPAIHMLVAPFRRLIKWKNRRILKQQPDLPLLFNPAHRLLRYRDILDAMPNQDAYVLQRHTRGVLLPLFNYALVEESAFDRMIYRVFDWMDRAAEPFGAGDLQMIAGHHKSA